MSELKKAQKREKKKQQTNNNSLDPSLLIINISEELMHCIGLIQSGLSDNGQLLDPTKYNKFVNYTLKLVDINFVMVSTKMSRTS